MKLFSEWKHWRHWRLRYRILLGLFILAFGIFMSGFLLMSNPDFQAWIKDQIISSVEKNLDARLTIQHISGNPFSYLRLEGIDMQGPDMSYIPQNHLYTKEVVVRFSLWQLLRGNLGFSSVRIASPTLYLDTRAFTKKQVPVPGGKGQRRPFNLNWLDLSDANLTIVYLDKEYLVRNAQLHGSFSMDSLATNILVRDFSGTVENLHVDQLRGRVTMSPNQITAKALHVVGNEIELDLDGQLTLGQKEIPSLDLHIKSNKLPVDKLLAFFPTLRSEPMTGTGQFSLDLSGPFERISGQGKLFAPKGQLGSIPYTQLSLKFSSVTSHFKLEDFSIDMLTGKIRATGEGKYIAAISGQTSSILSQGDDKSQSPSQLPFSLAINYQHIDITQIPSIDKTLSGTLDGQLNLNANLLQASSLKGTGSFTWSDGKYKGIENLSGKSEILVQSNNVHFVNTHFMNSEMDVKGNIDVLNIPQKNTKIEFNMNWASADLNKDKSFIHIPELTGVGKGQVHGVSENLSPLLVDGKFQLDSGQYGPIKFNHVDGIIYPDRRLDLTGTKLIWQNDWPVEKAFVQVQFGDKNIPKSRFIRFPQILLTQGETQVVSSGFVDSSTHQIQFAFKSDKARLQDVPAVHKQIPYLDGTVSLTGAITGKSDNVAVTAQFAAPSFRVEDTPVADPIDGTVTMENKILQFAAKAAGYSLRGNIDFHKPDPTIEVNADLRKARLILPAKTAKMQNLNGTLDGSVEVSGKSSNLHVAANLNSISGQLGSGIPFQFSRVTVFGQFQNFLQNGQMTAQIADFISSKPNQVHKTQLQNTILDISWQDRKSPDFRLSSSSGLIQGVPVSSLQSQFSSRESILDISYLRIRSQSGTLNLQGSLDLSKSSPPFQLTLDGNNLPAEQLFHFFSPDSVSSFSGLVSGQITLSGKSLKFADMDGDGKVTVDKIYFQKISADKLSSTFQIKDGKVQLSDTKLDFEKTSLKINGWFDSDRHLHLQFRGLLDNLAPFLEKGSGKADIDLTISNTLDHPAWQGTLQIYSGRYDPFSWNTALFEIKMSDAMKGTLNGSFSNFRIGTESFDKAKAEIAFQDPVVKLVTASLIRKNFASTISGQANTQSGEFSGDISGTNLLVSRWLSPEVTAWLVDSQLDIKAKILGNYKTYSGSLTVSQLDAHSGKSTLQLEEPAKIEWTPDKYTVYPFTLLCSTPVKTGNKKESSSISMVSGGSLNGSGTVTLKNNQPHYYDITLTAQKFSWPLVKGVNATFDSELKYNGNADKPEFSGDVKFTRIQITAPVIPAFTTGNTATGRIVSFPTLKTKMDVTLTADSAIFLQTEVLNLQAGGWIKVNTDAAGELEITHELKTIDGYVLYQNKKFPITKAEVRHTDPKIFNPYIDAEAKTSVRSIDIFFRVYGTLNDYDINLSSDPAYSQSDIFALLATGRTNEELRLQGKTDITSQVAAGYASEQVLNTLGSPVMKAVGVDNVTMEYDEVNNENVLKVEKNLKKKVTVSYSEGLAKESNSGGQLEYKVNKHVSVVGGVGVNTLTDEADGSIDLDFHFPTK